jgi:protein-S-isoprenylcysteine O-methyltransferase Ste14
MEATPYTPFMASSPTTESSTSDRLIAWLFVVGQLALIAAVFLLPGGDDWPVPEWLATAGRGLQIIGVVVLVAGAVNLGTSLTPLPTPVADGTLRTNGVYRYVRHPIYSGLMAIVAGSAMRSGSIIVAVVTLALMCWLMFKARWEERQLAERYEDYGAYASRTPRFLPGWPTSR